MRGSQHPCFPEGTPVVLTRTHTSTEHICDLGFLRSPSVPCSGAWLSRHSQGSWPLSFGDVWGTRRGRGGKPWTEWPLQPLRALPVESAAGHSHQSWPLGAFRSHGLWRKQLSALYHRYLRCLRDTQIAGNMIWGYLPETGSSHSLISGVPLPAGEPRARCLHACWSRWTDGGNSKAGLACVFCWWLLRAARHHDRPRPLTCSALPCVSLGF